MKFEITDDCSGKTFECDGRPELEETLQMMFDMEQLAVSEAVGCIVRDFGFEPTGWAQAFLGIEVRAL